MKRRSFRETFFCFCRVLLCLVGAAILFCPLPVRAQGVFGTISGTVHDEQQAAIPGANVILTNVDTGVSREAVTNEVGIYSATSLIPGVYRVEAQMPGFKKAVISDIRLEVNANLKINIALQVGEVTEILNVTSEAPLLTTQQSSLGQTVSQQQIEQLPTGRNLFSLLPLSAGVSQQTGCDGCENNGNMRINGDRPRTQDYILDGTTINAPVFGGQAFNPALDSISEFRVETNSMSAEYGKAAGGIIIAVTKTGTNQFHGSGYWYHRNESLNARNFFEDPSQPKNPFTQHELGGTIGGPILKDKLFFFSDFQVLRLDGWSPSVNNVVPNSAFRSGDLSALCTAGFDSAGVCADPSQQIRFPGTSQLVPFNRIPASQISPISQRFIDAWPTSTVGGTVPGTDLYSFSRARDNRTTRFNPRIDYQASASDLVFGVFHRQIGSQTTHLGILEGPAGEQIQRQNDYTFTAGWTHTFGSVSLNDFRFGFMHRIGDRSNHGQGTTSPSDFGLEGIPDCLSSVPNTEGGKKCGTPIVSVAGFTDLGDSGMLYEPADTLQINDTFSRLFGRHNLKFGGEARRYAIDNYQPDEIADFSFRGSQTGDAFADFLFGRIHTGSATVQNAMLSTRAWSYSLFIQDDFKLRPQLTLNLGLRYQYDQSFSELHDGLAFFNPFTAEWEQFGVNAPKTPFDPSRKMFGPRLGFAWSPANGFVVRGGYGITYPGVVGHGRAGDGQPGPSLLTTTNFPEGTDWSSLPAIGNPDPSAIRAPLPINDNVGFQSWAPRKQTPTYVQSWNLTLEKQITGSTLAQLAYVGTRGVHLPINYGYNMCQQTRESTVQYGWDAPTSPTCPLAAERMIAGGGSLDNLIIVPGYWGLSSSIYHAMQAKFERRFSRGFSLLANFTWSKLIDDSSSDWGGFWSLDTLGQDFYDRRSDRSVSAGDIPARLLLASIVRLPFGPGQKWLNQGVAGQVLGGWNVSAIYSVSSGSPFGILDNCYGYCNAAHMMGSRPMMISEPLPPGLNQTLERWFDTQAFDFSGNYPAPGLPNPTGPRDRNKAYGNAPRYFSNVRNPMVNNLDVSLQKDIGLPWGEETRLRVRGDFLNLPNHPQFAEPNGDLANPNFGRITRTSNNNRTVQLGLHFFF
ncbi:MAG: TonB-dependent receptor domain-containing protein [Acidobacteriota bacterium]